jgi:methyl-accepting chemotaxis protein
MESMRRGAATTARSVEDQAAASGQVSKESVRLTRGMAELAKALKDQAAGAAQIAKVGEDMRRQSDEIAKGMGEQARAMREITAGSGNIASQIKLISRANATHSSVAEDVLRTLTEVRRVTDRNAKGAKVTMSGMARLLESAGRVSQIVNGEKKRSSNGVTPSPQQGTIPAKNRRTSTPRGASSAAKSSSEPSKAKQKTAAN